ncbi:transporter family-2 protein [Formivibrio citricus]|uniref:Transporter family-2 protein n=1 Tax=Formivibrio citricus TaxID=83765 RepID=A0A1I5API6_9NEIS|nr:DMT family transporter [Formivibrio citricus]SFN64280.1 transporter family-2 protein [Formivibrio citricus]
MYPLYLLLALAIGLVVPLQSAVNNQLKHLIGGSTVLAAFVSFAVGTLALAVVAVFTQQKWSGLGQIGQASWWHLTGGLMGALFVFGTTLLAPRLGVVVMLALIICGQILASLLFDRFGWLGLPVREISTPRLIGAMLVLVGVLLVNFGDRLR